MKISNFNENVWDFGNEILYKLCEENFEHKETDKILAKTLFIGRIYSASIERRKPKKEEKQQNDKFYTEIIAPAFLKSNLDYELKKIKILDLSSEYVFEILKVHKNLQDILKKITDLEKRSFCSKYLHFHLPNLFFIYDTRAVKSLRKYEKNISPEFTKIVNNELVDKEYAIFFCKCLSLKKKLESEAKNIITPRILDNLLLNE